MGTSGGGTARSKFNIGFTMTRHRISDDSRLAKAIAVKNTFSLIYYPAILSIEDEFLESLCNRRTSEAEERLMLAVLEDAIHCFFQCLSAKDEKKRRSFEDTEKWILGKNSDWIFSFESICETLEINPSCLRGKLIRWKESKSTPPLTDRSHT